MSNGDAKVSEVIEMVSPDIRVVLDGLIAKAGANGEITVDALLEKYPFASSLISMDEKRALFSLAFAGRNRFAPKLTTEQRCEILALHRWGMPGETLAKIYGIDRRTVTHIHNPMSSHYKNIRDLEIGMGRDKFAEKFLNEDLMNKVLAFQQAAKKESKNNQFAKTKAGVHVVRGKFCQYEHRVMIQWRDNSEDTPIAGWYYKDLDSDFPESWFAPNDEAMRTSQACYNAMLADISDKISTT